MSTETHCPYCSLQCGMRLAGRRSPEVSAWEEFPVNQGALCRKGWAAAGLYGGRERLTSPLVRDRETGEWSSASWDDALDRVVAGIRAAQAAKGPDAVAVFGGGGLTNEKAYALGKLARVALGTSQIDYNGRWCMSSAASAGIRAFGLDRGLPFPLADVEETDVLVLVGSNLAETMPPAARHLDRLRERGGRVVVIDPRRTPTADRADLHLQPVPGTDLVLALGVLHLLVAGGAVDEAYLAERTTGWEQVRDSAAAWWPERVERVTGIEAHEVRALAAMLAGSPRVMVLTARGAEQHSPGSAGAAPATAASPDRATARAVASTARRPTSCPATAASTTPPPAPTWPGCGGWSPTRCPAPAGRRTSSSTPSARPRGPRRCWSSGPTSWSARRTPPTSRRGWSRSTCSWCATS
jgi:assimilatory nitrate reductase catalytic subunit